MFESCHTAILEVDMLEWALQESMGGPRSLLMSLRKRQVQLRLPQIKVLLGCLL